MPRTQSDGALHDLFCQNMRGIREKSRVTQDELAVRMDVSRCYVSDLERGRNCPTLALVEKIASALNVKPDKLLRAPNKPRTKNFP
jgi:transcriptional regulator with XRE-family HTH domain